MGNCISVPADVDYSYFKIGKELGKGGFGKVHVAIRNSDRKKHGKDHNYEFLALKRISKAKLLGIDKTTRTPEDNNRNTIIEADKTAAMMLWMERAVMVLMRSPYTVRLMHAFQTPDELVLVMPCYSGGDVSNHLRNSTMSEDDLRVWAAELLDGIAHIHSYHFVFRDIKPLNLLIDSEGHLAITDFGLCRLLEEKNGFSIVGRGGTRGYRSPEAAAGYAYDFSCDFFSFGVTLYEMATGRRKVQSLHAGVQQSSNDVKANSRLSAEFKDLIRRLTVTNPADRLGCELSTKRMVERCRRLGLSINDFNGSPNNYKDNRSDSNDEPLYPDEKPYNSRQNSTQQNTVLTIDPSSPSGNDHHNHRSSAGGIPPSTPSNARNAHGTNYNDSRASGNFQQYNPSSGRAAQSSDKGNYIVDGWQYRTIEEIDNDNNFHWNAVRNHPFFRSIDWSQLPKRSLKTPFVPDFKPKEFYTSSFEATPPPNLSEDTKDLPQLTDRQQELFMDFEFNIDVSDPINLNEPPPFTVDELTAQFIPSSHNTGANGGFSSTSGQRDRSVSISQSAPSLNCSTYTTSRYDGVVTNGVSTNGGVSRPSISTPKQTFRPTPSTMIPHLDDEADSISNVNSPSTRKPMRPNTSGINPN